MASQPESHIVDVAAARLHGLAFAHVVVAVDERLAAAQGELALRDDPLVIYDVSGDQLFYDFSLLAGDTPVGYVRTAADARVGTPAVAVERSRRPWDPVAATAAAARRAGEEGASVVHDTRLVCYCYPKLGIQITTTGSDGERRTQIFDVASGSPVGEETDDPSDQVGVRSYLAGLDARARLADFAESAGAIAQLVVPGEPINLPKLPAEASAQVWLDPACRKTPGLPMYAQITNYNCVPASAEMVLDHYGWNFTQAEIAQAMGTTPPSGTSYAGFANGIATLTKGTMTPSQPDINWTRAQQWELVTSELAANRPVFTQMPGHYRVCMAFASVLFFQMLHIHDPWPWNANVCGGGADYWENWNGTSIEWFVTLRH
jgi:hypothetical protein